MDHSIAPLDSSRRDDFFAVLERSGDEPRTCLCTAFYGVDLAQSGRARACRDSRIAGQSDGYLLYVDRRPVGWVQCGPLAMFDAVAQTPAEPGAWAITCLVLAPEARGQGLAHVLFTDVLAALRARGVPYVIAFGHRLGPTYSSPLAELPESVCVKAGMVLVRDHPECPRYGLRL